MSLSAEDRARRLAAKRHNERMKLVANFFNALAIAVAGVAAVLPALNEPGLLLTTRPWILFSIALVLHSLAQGAISVMKSED